jgi:hypothetical protein
VPPPFPPLVLKLGVALQATPGAYAAEVVVAEAVRVLWSLFENLKLTALEADL